MLYFLEFGIAITSSMAQNAVLPHFPFGKKT